jgi:hypothetical protein
VADLIEPHVALPYSLNQWLIDQPDSVLSIRERQKHLMQTDYTMPTPHIMENMIHTHVVKADLTRRVHTLTAEIWLELERAFEESWGIDTDEWKEVNVFQTMSRIFTRTSNRVLVGEELSEFFQGCFRPAAI